MSQVSRFKAAKQRQPKAAPAYKLRNEARSADLACVRRWAMLEAIVSPYVQSLDEQVAYSSMSLIF